MDERDDPIERHGVATLMDRTAYSIQYVWARDVIHTLKRMMGHGLLTQAITALSSRYLDAVLEYDFYSGGAKRAPSVDALSSCFWWVAFPSNGRTLTLGTMTMIFAEQCAQRGEQRGREKGEQKKALLIAKNRGAKGLALSLIEEVTGLSNDVLRALMH